MVLLETVSGRRNFDVSEKPVGKGYIGGIVDKRLNENDIDAEQLERAIEVSKRRDRLPEERLQMDLKILLDFRRNRTMQRWFSVCPARVFPLMSLLRDSNLCWYSYPVETTIEDIGRCRYARTLVEVDLRHPLCPGVSIGTTGHWQPFVYEKIPVVCQRCGRITHPTDRCMEVQAPSSPPAMTSSVSEINPPKVQRSSQNPPTKEVDEGRWQVVPPRRRPRQSQIRQEVEAKDGLTNVETKIYPYETQSLSTVHARPNVTKPYSQDGTHGVFQSPKVSRSDTMHKGSMSKTTMSQAKNASQPRQMSSYARKPVSLIVHPLGIQTQFLTASKDKSLPMSGDNSTYQSRQLIHSAVDCASKKRSLDMAVMEAEEGRQQADGSSHTRALEWINHPRVPRVLRRERKGRC
ncbi:G-type lectin S-receptor-like serine/threonine-protein kinase [Acorus calamus]|uniref:G-type lectin S-receptor-like serine/threonine-protein kinase n=1 Tax=Acorus calamus TaxID=4465 RepID=A0AAV9DIH8_ACOCL|nr:G-type lectin S-receptor-like serine/threonine-protein kinase [Acorus calamus]